MSSFQAENRISVGMILLLGYAVKCYFMNIKLINIVDICTYPSLLKELSVHIIIIVGNAVNV